MANFIRSTATAVFTPVLFSYKSGHFRSSFKMAAVSRNGDVLPWYTYPAVDFLKHRTYADKTVLEFGGGQSTLWWADRAKYVVTFEGDRQWHDKLKGEIPANVELFCVSMESAEACENEVESLIAKNRYESFDVIIVDGLYRTEMAGIAERMLSKNGIIILDNAESYEFYEKFHDGGLSRVDFFGQAPGVILPHCTSILFKDQAFVFSSKYPIAEISGE